MGRNVDNIGGVAQAAVNAGIAINRRNIRFFDGGGVTWSVLDNIGTDTAEVTASASGVGIPVGTVVAKASTVVPAGWLECNGSSQLVASFPALFADIGYTHGGAGANFNLPNCARRTLVGRGGVGTGTLGNVVGNVGGAETHVLTVGELASHGHGDPGHFHNSLDSASPAQYWNQLGAGSPGITPRPTWESRDGGNPFSFVTSPANANVSNNGGNGAHNNVQPSLIAMWIIKT